MDHRTILLQPNVVTAPEVVPSAGWFAVMLPWGYGEFPGNSDSEGLSGLAEEW